jgi:hypothetical protein
MQKTTSASPETMARRKIGQEAGSPTCSQVSGAPRPDRDPMAPVRFDFTPRGFSLFALLAVFAFPQSCRSFFARFYLPDTSAKDSPKPHDSGLFELRSSFKFASFRANQLSKRRRRLLFLLRRPRSSPDSARPKESTLSHNNPHKEPPANWDYFASSVANNLRVAPDTRSLKF